MSLRSSTFLLESNYIIISGLYDGSYQCKPLTVVRVKCLVEAVGLSREPPQHRPEINTGI